MALWKCMICLAFLAVVLSDEVPEEPKSIEIKHSDLLKIFPDQKEKMEELIEKLSKANEKAQVAILNDYTDDCLKNLNEFIILQSMDPVPMPDIEEGFEWKVLLITYHGVMSLTKGWLQGMGTMQRSGDVTLQYSYPYVTVHAPLGFKNILFNYDYKAQFMGLGPTGGVDGKVDGCRFTFDIKLHMVNLKAEMQNFRINTLGKVSLKFTGNVLVDWMVNIFVSVTIPFVTPVIRLVIQGFASGLFTSICDVYNGIICKILDDCPEQLANLIF